MRIRWTAADVKEFCGWDFIEKVVNAGAIKRDRALMSAAFLTGGRMSEVLSLKHEHFILDQDDTYIIVRSMPRFKSYAKTGFCDKWKCVEHCKMRWDQEPTDALREHHGKIEQYLGWRTRPMDEYRTFPIHRGEPITQAFIEYLRKFEGSDAYLFNIKYSRAYVITTKIGRELGTHIPTHWFRAQRASQLAYEYGFNEHDLVEYFKWQDYRTAFHYASKGYKGLTQKMVR